LKAICEDLRQEYEVLDALVASRSVDEWHMLTPFNGWSVYDVIAHICFTDMNALLAMADPEAFNIHASKLREWAEVGKGQLMLFTYEEMGRPSEDALLAKWRNIRWQLLSAAEAHSPKDRFPWYGPSMSTRSLITARLMETWAHGQDICDTFKVSRENTRRLRHIAHLGVQTWQWSFIVNQMEPPTLTPYIELTAPSGELWRWGDESAENSVKGEALDFCLLVTRCRHWQDLDLQCIGAAANAWLPIAQCFAGGQQAEPAPGERVWT